MLRPYTSNLIEVRQLNPGEFGIFANSQIAPNTVIEVCPTISLSGRVAIALTKSDPTFEKRIVVDQLVIDREYEIFTKLGEMELERRLEEGQISQDDYLRILRSKVDLNSVMNAKSHVLVLGYGMLYRTTEFPNLVREYHPNHKLCLFRSVQYIEEGAELTYFS